MTDAEMFNLTDEEMFDLQTELGLIDEFGGVLADVMREFPDATSGQWMHRTAEVILENLEHIEPLVG